MSEQIFANFPYEKKFTKAQITEITESAQKLADAMRDGVGPNGMVMGLDESMLQLWCVHGALAGVRVHPDEAYIVAVPIPDEHLQFADSVEWKLRDELPEDYDAEKDSEKAKQIADAMKSQLTDAQRRQIAASLIEGFETANNTEEK